MPVPDGDVVISFNIPRDVRDTINAMKEADPKYSRRYIFLCGYEALMGLTEDDSEIIKRDLEHTRDEKAVLENKEKQLIEKLKAIEAREKAEIAEKVEEVNEVDKIVSEIMRVSTEIIFFKNTQMLKYIKGLLSDKSPLEVDVFFDRREIPTEEEIRVFLRG